MSYYYSPEFGDTGYIDLRPSQEGVLGIPCTAAFAQWMASGGMENLAPGIEYKDGVLSGTIPGGFNVNDQFTWYLILE